MAEDGKGINLIEQLRDPPAPRSLRAICTDDRGNHSVCDRRWRNVGYADGSEELYGRVTNPGEHRNLLASGPEADAMSVVVARSAR